MADHTHGLAGTASGLTTTADVIVANLTLPAEGPWTIHGVWAQVMPQTATAAEYIGGTIRINSASGDIEPDPAPSRYPATSGGSFLGATSPVVSSPLNLFNTQMVGAGKAAIQLIYNQSIACTVAPKINAGILFGPRAPERRPFMFVDRIHAVTNSAAPSVLGHLTLSEKATRIIGVCGILAQDGVLVAAEELGGYFYLTSDDVNLVPLYLPFNNAYGGGLGATIANPGIGKAEFIPVDIPVTGGSRVTATSNLATAVTNAANFDIFIAYM